MKHKKNIIEKKGFLKENLSIVIPCKNEGLGLIATLVQILTYQEECEIIISDSSTDQTLNYLEKFNLGEKIKIVNGGLPSIARNNGFAQVRTPYVLFLDADMDISKVPLHEMVLAMTENNLKLSTCRISTANPKYAFFYRIFDFIQGIISLKTPFAVGGFMLFESSHFNSLGGFNKDDKIAEDYHLSMKVDPKEFKIFGWTALTSDRRFKNKGIWYMCRLMLSCWINRNNDEFYKKDYNYWK